MSEVAESGAGRYAVKAKIGHGGMGAVYRVADLHGGVELALKRLHLPEDANRTRTLIELFQQEFRTLAQLAHPNVVAVHDFGTDEQGPYYTMELLDGEHLHALAPLPWIETCALMRDVCSAVALLHSRRLLHRDPSPKNVQRTRDGRAKLIDFGAMALMGPSKTLVGTPPLVPPEALLQQPLDASADLYAIGGTLYYALTGKHAYPAHNIAQLATLWRTPPLPPSAHVPDIPAELDQLVLSLLSLEPLARPSSAAEVLDRLAAIAGLPRDEQLAVSRAYLSTPQLVGRAEQVASVRERLAALHARRGGVIAIEGASGMGRSRMLDVCVLEAKLTRMAVLRANAADAATGSYGALSSLVRQLGELYGGAKVARPHADALALLAKGGITPAIDTARRAELQRAFQAQLEAIANVQPVVIAIDDVERCDEPSLAALAVAVASARERVLIALSCLTDENAHDAGPLAVLMHDAARIPLPALGRADTEALLASVFGEVPSLQALTARIHERAEGTARGCMELSQYLLDRGLVRYELGSWVLPPLLEDAELPRTLSVARREKLAALPADARELAEVLALCEGSALDVEGFAELTAHGDPERVRRALDDLLLAQILRSDNATYVFEAQLWPGELEACLLPADAQRACGRIADALARRGHDRLEVASYRLRAGQAAFAIDLLLEELAKESRWNRAPPSYDKLLRGAIEACDDLARPRRDRMVLLRELIKVGQDLAALDLRDHTLELLAELRRDSGLNDWELPGAPSDPLEHLRYVCERMQAQHETCAARDRGFGQLEAIIALGVLASETCAIAARTADAKLLDVVPRFEPFYPLSPALQRIDEVTAPACRAVIGARYAEARALYEGQLEALLDPAVAGVPEDLRAWGIRALRYALGNIDASLGREQALVQAAEIENVPGWLVPAYSIRQIYHLTLGNLRQAERYRRQIELSRLQSAIKPPFAAAAVFQHLFVFAMTDNPNGMRAAIPELEALGRSYPGMRPFVLYARAEHARICGDCEEALIWIGRGNEQVRAGEHPVWPWLVTSWLFTLAALGRYDEARAIGLGALEAANRVGLTLLRANIDAALALVEARLGDFASACTRIDHVIDDRMAQGVNGVALGMTHEVRARVAVWMNDTQAFERHAQLCAQHFSKSGGEPAVAAKYARLMQEARHHGFALRGSVAEAMADQTTIERTGITSEILPVIGAALSACGSRAQRLRRALELIVNDAAAQHGELFLIGERGLVVAAATADDLGSAELIPALSRMVDMSHDIGATAFTAAFELYGRAQPDGTPTRVQPLLLLQVRDAETAVAGIVTLHFAASAAVRLPAEVANAVAEALIEAGDVTPQPIGGSAITARR